MKKIFSSTFKIVLIISTFELISCAGVKVTCPEFGEEILSWIPYQANDMIELYSQSNDSTIIFSIKNVEITHTTHYITGTDCSGCDDKVLIRDYDDYRYRNNSKFQVDIRLRKNKVEYQSYYIGDTNFYSYSECKKFLFENEEYDTVQVFEKTDTKGRFTKLIIAKGIGVLGLIDIYGNTWMLKNNAKIERLNEPDKLGNIVIYNVSCE